MQFNALLQSITLTSVSAHYLIAVNLHITPNLRNSLTNVSSSTKYILIHNYVGLLYTV